MTETVRRPQWRRRRRRPRFSLCVATGDDGKRSVPATPLLQWKFVEQSSSGGQPQRDPGGESLRKHKKQASGSKPAASARRLAAGIWHLRLPKVVGGGETSLDLKINYGQQHLPHVSSGNVFNLHPDTNEDFINLLAIKNGRNGISHKLEASASLLPSFSERVTKWDLGYRKVSRDAFHLYDNRKPLQDQKTNKFSLISALRSELELARSKVSELEVERQSTKKKLDHFMRKIEEKAAWRRREHEKIRSVIDAMKEDLNRERKNAQRLEIMNAKLVNELAEAKLSSKQFLQEYEKERKARELMEEVCNELAKEIGNDKAEVEALKLESVKTREEVEEERKMLQTAEAWREERVQMKLIDAKLALEEKYSKLSKLQEEVEAFLSLRSDNMMFNGNCDEEEDESGWETASHVEEQDSSVSGADCDKHRDDEKQTSEISEVCSITTRQSRKNGYSLSRIWKSSHGSYAEDFKKISFELTNGLLCNGRSFNATLSPSRMSTETGISLASVGNWSSPDLLNSHISNGVTDSNTKMQSLKAKLMEARIQSQKVQLRQVLKQKI